MTQLAYDKNGHPVEPPPEAAGWQVRKLPANRGAPALVYNDLGTPLVVPVDTEAEDFRKLVQGRPGRYRLDPVDAGHCLCKDAVSAVVFLSGEAANDNDGDDAEATAGPSGIVSELLAQTRALMEANIDLTKSIASGQAAMITSSAGLVQAADGAGLSAREPKTLLATFEEFRNAFMADGDASEDAEPNAGQMVAPAPAGGMQEVLAMKAINDFLPMFQYMIQTKWMGLTPDQASALTGVGGAPASKVAATPATPVEVDAGQSDDDCDDATPVPMTDAEMYQHMMQVIAQLTPRERQIAMNVSSQMTTEQQGDWKQRLAAMSVPDAVRVVRAQVNGNPNAAKGTA